MKNLIFNKVTFCVEYEGKIKIFSDWVSAKDFSLKNKGIISQCGGVRWTQKDRP